MTKKGEYIAKKKEPPQRSGGKEGKGVKEG